MKAIFTLFFLGLISSQIQAQSCGERYRSRYFSSVQKFENVVYSQDAPELLASSLGIETTYPLDLKMDIYMPPPTDPVQARPLIILAHGGGFINVLFMGGTVLVGTKENDDVQALADTLAHWGYVTASIQYRTGFDIANGTSIKRAVWRGAQDMSAAVRFFRKNANWFNIDPEKIFVGGSSAGAFCAIHSTFVDSNERIAESFQVTPLVMPDLGALHSRPVVSLTGFNPFAGNNVLGNDVDSMPIGVAAYWGAIADLDMFGGNNQAPMIMFHGESDPIVPIDCNKPFSSVILTAPVTCGSNEMNDELTSLGMPHELHTAPGEGHEYWGALNGGWLPTGPNAYWLPIIQNTAEYFYDIAQPAPAVVTGGLQVLPNIVYTYNISNAIAGGSYCWQVEGGTIVSPSSTGSSVEVLWYNSYAGQRLLRARRVDAAGYASDETVKNVDMTTSSVTTFENSSLRLFPNPANERVNIELGQVPAGNYSIRIYDLLGRDIWHAPAYFSVNEPIHTLDIACLAPGVYRLQISNEQIKWTKELVVGY